ncbi:CynX/NimT family MFS transporter [Microbacterium pseudoresistens]|uniref:CP family cyanate transporter-like MFS transporter n=1 Tax=Microbacterium pseudoresistens TaxID=640634 RepID=A0A7Y9ETM2_9MICO|nr:MFS transporter [Microbacterium pseudoresistens]NYD53566.1 CP family cyanate transporter-like MFS transporter [Microbacterium pseudoresistens]
MRARRPMLLAIVALCLIASLMRPAVTAVGPVIDRISADTGIPVALLGSLSTIVLITWAVVSPFAHGFGRRLGLGGAVLAAMGLLAVGVAIRSLPGSPAWLWIGTALIGVALAIGNVLLPAVIKKDFPLRVPLMMGVYSAILGGAGAVASGLAVPIADLTGADAGAGWRLSLAITGAVVAPLALVFWGLISRHEMRAVRAAAPGRAPRTGIWRDPVAWQVAVYMGVQSTSFYVLVTWISTMSLDTGRSATIAGVDVMIYQIFGLVGSLAVALVMHGRAARITPAALPVLGILAVIGLMVLPDAIGFWAVPLGLFSGASLGVSLTLIAERAPDHSTSSALSGMSQSVGYAIAAIGPALFGGVHAATASWTVALIILLVAMAAQAAIGLFAARERYVLAR